MPAKLQKKMSKGYLYYRNAK